MLDGVGSLAEDAARTCAGLRDVDNLCDARAPDGLEELDRRLACLCREQGPVRALVARIAWRLVDLRAWERIGYARLSDYAVEQLGLSGRSLQSLARVGRAFLRRPALERALVSGRLGWTRVRLLAGLPPEEDVEAWIARAERSPADRLAKQVRAVDRYSADEAAAATAAGGGVLELRCRPDVRRKWETARGVASRAAGRRLGIAAAAELIAAEILSALPAAAPDEAEADAPATAAPEGEPVPETHEAWRGAALAGSGNPRLAPELRRLQGGLDGADAFALDGRLRRALAYEQSLETRIAPLLVRAWQPGVHRALGFTTRDAWVRERLEMDPTRARALVRLERACAESPPLARAWRNGALSWVKAAELVPLVSADPLGRFVEDWVSWAGQVTVRRLRDDVGRALALAETDPEVFRREGGLPRETRPGTAGDEADRVPPHREIGADHRDPHGEASGSGRVNAVGGASPGEAEREIGADHRDPQVSSPERSAGLPSYRLAARAHAGLGCRPGPDETCWVRLFGPREVVRLFRTALCTVRRRIEADTGRLPTAGEALEAMLDHAFAAWGHDAKVPARHRVFARDGWRCAAPGCSSMQNLHDHHIRFRSAGGSNAPANRVTLCAFHHLRGIHAGRLRCTGRAPGALVWQIGIRRGATPLLTYRSGDIRVPVTAAL